MYLSLPSLRVPPGQMPFIFIEVDFNSLCANGDFSKTAKKPKNLSLSNIKSSKMHHCVNISLITNVLERIQLENNFVQKKLLITCQLTEPLIHSVNANARRSQVSIHFNWTAWKSVFALP